MLIVRMLKAQTLRQLDGAPVAREPDSRLTGFNPLEYDLGVYTNDRRLKPTGATIAALAREFDQAPPKPIHRSSALVLREFGIY